MNRLPSPYFATLSFVSPLLSFFQHTHTHAHILCYFLFCHLLALYRSHSRNTTFSSSRGWCGWFGFNRDSQRHGSSCKCVRCTTCRQRAGETKLKDCETKLKDCETKLKDCETKLKDCETKLKDCETKLED